MSDKPVAERLQVKGDRRLAVIGASATLEKTIGAGKARGDAAKADVVLLFAADRKSLDGSLPKLLKTMSPAAIFWVGLSQAVVQTRGRPQPGHYPCAGAGPRYGQPDCHRRRLVRIAVKARLVIVDLYWVSNDRRFISYYDTFARFEIGAMRWRT